MLSLTQRTLGAVRNGSTADGARVGAWAVIKGNAPAKTHSSFNISALTDNGAGDYTLSFSRAFNATAYAVVMMPTGILSQWVHNGTDDTNVPTSTTVRIFTLNVGGALVYQDPTTAMIVGEY